MEPIPQPATKMNTNHSARPVDSRKNRWIHFRRSFGFLAVLAMLIGRPHAAEQRLTVTAEMLSGPLVFFASPAGLAFNSPVPYGIANNLSDSGWIWPNDNSGLLQVDFGVPTALTKFRV